jgi:branched-chain amino acid transport system ATP-binding protein/neutral amino acid transport system ATP-binding protein
VALLLDEPSAGLAPLAADKLFETVVAINKDGVSMAMVEQNARRGYVLVDGNNSVHGPAAGPTLRCAGSSSAADLGGDQPVAPCCLTNSG